MRQQIGQQMMIGIAGPELTPQEADFITKNNIAGVTLFDRNLKDPEQIASLCRSLQALRHKMPDKSPLFIAVDMEGGRVHRLKPPFTQWPSMQKLGEVDSTSGTFQLASMMGAELKAVGINLDFAPCVDVLTNPKNAVIGDRSLGSDPEHVAKLASALVRGYIKSGILACIKHFPGHGNTSIDSHEDLPVEDSDLSRLESLELIPFKKAFRARVDLVMTAHIRFSKIDPEWPVSLSPQFLTEILRNRLRYRNLVMTDDLDMKALTKHYDRKMIAVQALKAGANILLYCNDPTSPEIAMEAIEQALTDKQLSATVIEQNHRNVLNLKREKITNPEPLSMEEIGRILGSPEHLKVAKFQFSSTAS